LTEGRILLDNADISKLRGKQRKSFRRRMQVVLQNPYDALNPRWNVKNTIEEPLILHKLMGTEDRMSRVTELLRLVRLDEGFLNRYPRQLSGGQLQRVGIARALATNPDFIVLDEPVSALDTITRVEILDLLSSIQEKLGISYLFISHNLNAVRRISKRIAVMYLGKIIEENSTEKLFSYPQHPYTRSLLSAVLEPKLGSRKARARLLGEPPSPIDPPSGCALHPRCPVSKPECGVREQQLMELVDNQRVACMRITNRENITWPKGWGTIGSEEKWGASH
jgi:oligopeptide/dipeptide ABC transporter ATP-binding protein